jgi:hypothetical protein
MVRGWVTGCCQVTTRDIKNGEGMGDWVLSGNYQRY